MDPQPNDFGQPDTSRIRRIDANVTCSYDPSADDDVLIALVLGSSENSVEPARMTWLEYDWRGFAVVSYPRGGLAEVVDDLLQSVLETLPLLFIAIPGNVAVPRHDEDSDLASTPRVSVARIDAT